MLLEERSVQQIPSQAIHRTSDNTLNLDPVTCLKMGQLVSTPHYLGCCRNMFVLYPHKILRQLTYLSWSRTVVIASALNPWVVSCVGERNSCLAIGLFTNTAVIVIVIVMIKFITDNFMLVIMIVEYLLAMDDSIREKEDYSLFRYKNVYPLC